MGFLFRPVWACHVSYFFGKKYRSVFCGFTYLGRLGGPGQLSNLFPFFMFDKSKRWGAPASKRASSSSPPVLNYGHSLTYLFSQERFLEYPHFPRVRRSQQKWEISVFGHNLHLTPVGDLSFSYLYKDPDNEILKVR